MKKNLLTWALVLSAIAPTHAAVVLNDSFSYPDGNLVGAPGSPWTIHSGADANPVQVTNGEIRVVGNSASAQDVNALLSGGPYLSNSTAVLYSSFKMRVTVLPGAAGTYFAHFKDTNTGAATGFGGRIWLNTTNFYTGATVGSGQFRIGIANGTSGSSASGQLDVTLSSNTSYTVVTRFVPNTGVATLWLNPSAESDPSVTATDPGTSGRPNAIDVVAYAFRQATGGEGTIVVDDLRVGTLFSDVAGPNNPPTISGVPRQNTPEGVSTAPLPFTVTDVETAAGSLGVTGASSNPSLVTIADIVFGGSDSNRTVTIKPEAGQQGFTTITLTVTDEGGETASTSFLVGVGVPTISTIPNQITPTNTTLGPVSFTVNDTESPAGDLTVTATSGNQTLLPDANIAVGGSGATRTVTLTPAPDQAGLVAVTVSVSDGVSTSSNSFQLTVYPLLGLLRTDDFNRPDGPLVTGDGEWLSNGGAGGTNIGQMQIIANRLQVTSKQSEDVSTEMPPGQFTTPTYPPSSGVIFYVGMSINYQVLPNAVGAYFAHFRDGSTGFRGKIFALQTGAASGHYRIGVANSANAIVSGAVIQTDLATNQSYNLVLRYNNATAESHLWLAPTSESSPGVDAIDGAQPLTVEAYNFRQNSDIGTVLVDNLKIGTSFSDVVSVPPTLRLTINAGMAELRWPATYTGYTLQSATVLPSDSWSAVSASYQVDGGDNLVSTPVTTDNTFFRLTK